jgi:hypothetical protein
MKHSAKHIYCRHFPEDMNYEGNVVYIWVNLRCANGVVSHISAVNGSVNSYRNLPDNLNYMADSCHNIDQFICSYCMMCCTAAITLRCVIPVVCN